MDKKLVSANPIGESWKLNGIVLDKNGIIPV